jgi:hypothetical protein
VELAGQRYCGSCKVLAIEGRTIVLEDATLPCKDANEALTYAIVSLFCLGFIFGPVAVAKAFKARKEIEADPRLTGWGKANAAIFIGIIAFTVWVFSMLGKTRHKM